MYVAFLVPDFSPARSAWSPGALSFLYPLILVEPLQHDCRANHQAGQEVTIEHRARARIFSAGREKNQGAPCSATTCGAASRFALASEPYQRISRRRRSPYKNAAVRSGPRSGGGGGLHRHAPCNKRNLEGLAV
jgi:hypothetical protein